MVTDVTIVDPGLGYEPDDTPAVTFTEGIEDQAEYDAEFTFSITDVNMSTFGSGYTQTAPNVTILGSGTGATAHAVMSAYIDSITVTAPGSAYTQAPQITISDNFSAWDGAIPVMTMNNPLFSIAYDGTNETLWPVSPLPTAVVTGDGAGATASVTLSSLGRVNGYGALVGGSGYLTPPVVTISGGGGFDGINITDPGQGYTSVPTFAFSGGGGTVASATCVLGFPVQTITMTAAGVGYNDVSSILVSNTVDPDEDYVDECVVKYSMGVRLITLDPENGWYYSAVPTVTITPKDANGSGATTVANVLWGINDIVVDNPGSGYKSDDENNVFVRIDAPTAPTGVQATASAELGNGMLSAVGPVSLGEGYTAPPNVYVVNDISGGSKGVSPTTQAQLTATVSNGHVTGLTITNPGAGYDFDSYVNGDYYIDITTFNSLALATAKANPKSGQIDFIQIDSPGEGYVIVPTVEIVNTSSVSDANMFGSGATATAVPTVTFSPSIPGKGTGATGVAILNNGRIDDIVMTNQGSGYIGKNKPTTAQSSPSTGSVLATAGKSYVRDLNFGTGKRTVVQ